MEVSIVEPSQKKVKNGSKNSFGDNSALTKSNPQLEKFKKKPSLEGNSYAQSSFGEIEIDNLSIDRRKLNELKTLHNIPIEEDKFNSSILSGDNSPT